MISNAKLLHPLKDTKLFMEHKIVNETQKLNGWVENSLLTCTYAKLYYLFFLVHKILFSLCVFITAYFIHLLLSPWSSLLLLVCVSWFFLKLFNLPYSKTLSSFKFLQKIYPFTKKGLILKLRGCAKDE